MSIPAVHRAVRFSNVPESVIPAFRQDNVGIVDLGTTANGTVRQTEERDLGQVYFFQVPLNISSIFRQWPIYND